MKPLKEEIQSESFWRALTAEFLGVSGGQLNPAVSLALLFSKRISPLRALLYMIMQTLGATAASALLYVLSPEDVRGELGLNKPSPGVTQSQALAVEIIVTFQLVMCVFTISHKESNFKGSAIMAVGASVTLGHLVAIGFTGCSMNPARSLGPAIITTNFSHHWVNREIESILKNGIIEVGCSQWSSPIVMVPKPDGTQRLCVDYRKGNAVTRTDSYPITCLKDCIEKVGQSAFISNVQTWKEHLKHRMEFFDRLQEAGLVMILAESEFGEARITFLEEFPIPSRQREIM
ncbi:aquaporin-5-like isoform X2 [Scyliorhinus torazame]|uniref:aquaporin-5-like isoform X2 n=1 Tax=Scyliorhinus torazame TaxID=75743 RepID=UPI003B59C578